METFEWGNEQLQLFLRCSDSNRFRLPYNQSHGPIIFLMKVLLNTLIFFLPIRCVCNCVFSNDSPIPMTKTIQLKLKKIKLWGIMNKKNDNKPPSGLPKRSPIPTRFRGKTGNQLQIDELLEQSNLPKLGPANWLLISNWYHFVFPVHVIYTLFYWNRNIEFSCMRWVDGHSLFLLTQFKKICAR